MKSVLAAAFLGSAVARDVFCETCQVIVLDATKRFHAAPKSKQSGRKAAMLRVDILDKTCEYGKFSSYGDLAQLSPGEMTDACGYILPEIEETLDEELGEKDEGDLREALCLQKGASKGKKGKKKKKKKGYCEALWAQDDHPERRLTPAMKAMNEATEFLEAKKQEEGVKSLPSGLLFKVLEKGSGTVYPTRDDQVKVHYRGTLTDGMEFDSSYARNAPATFGVGQVIVGWTEALQLMTRGDVWELYIPSDLAYGTNGSPPNIPGNSALIFKVELLGVIGKDEEPESVAAESDAPDGKTEAVESKTKTEL